jgi:hypothetical protein
LVHDAAHWRKSPASYGTFTAWQQNSAAGSIIAAIDTAEFRVA